MRLTVSIILAILLFLVFVDDSEAEEIISNESRAIPLSSFSEFSLPASPLKVIDDKYIPDFTAYPPFIYDRETSFYGPGFYGKRTACGLAYTKTIMGVAHKSLPCGTLVDFKYKGKIIRVPVIDRGPYVDGRIWDLSGALCTALDHCYTGPIEYRIIGKAE